MTDEEIATVCAYIASNWPAAKMTDGTVDVYRLELAPLDFDETVATLRHDCADDEFPPTPMRLRNKVLRRSRPPVTAEELVAELQVQISRVGYMGAPLFSHPALDEYVRREGGWTAVCEAARAASAPDYGIYYAQARNLMRVLLERDDRDHTHAALEAAATVALER